MSIDTWERYHASFGITLPHSGPHIRPQGSITVANTMSDTVELVYSIDPDTLTVDQQIALAHAYAALAQAERLDWIYQRLDKIHQLLVAINVRIPTPSPTSHAA